MSETNEFALLVQLIGGKGNLLQSDHPTQRQFPMGGVAPGSYTFVLQGLDYYFFLLSYLQGF